MNKFRMLVPRLVKEQVAEFKKNAAKTGQPTSLTIYVFNDTVHQIAHCEDVFDFKDDFTYSPDGNTALLDCVGTAISDSQHRGYAQDPSHLIITITDGQENRSASYNVKSLSKLMNEVECTDKWTFVFSVPPGGTRTLAAFGIPAGNVQEWEGTEAGIRNMNTNTVSGISGYFDARSKGLTRSSNFFQVDMNKVARRDIVNLKDVYADYRMWDVDRESPIREFVEVQLGLQPALARKVGGSYQLGRGYYQLTKSEEVQASKDIVILDKKTNCLYGGQQARDLLGCPMGISFKIKPGNHGNYEIFIKSTSVNRKLLPGTKMLYHTA